MKYRAATTVFSLLAVAAMAVSAGDAVTLKRNPKVGEKASYKMSIDIEVQGMAINVAFDMTNTVSKINSDGSYVVSEVDSNQVVTMNGQQMDQGGEEQKSDTTYSADGSVLAIKSDEMMGGEYAIANLTSVIWPTKPVDVGSKWDGKVMASEKNGVPEITTSYEVVAREKLAGKDCLKINFTAKGGEMSNSGTVWVEVGSGLTVKSMGQMKSVTIQGMPMDPKYVLEMKA
jgi:hypothetical protein